MLTKSEVARFAIGLVEAQDANLIDDDSVLSTDICAPSDRAAIRRLRDLLQSLYEDFDFLVSPKFKAMTSDRSMQYSAALRRRFSAPEQQRKIRSEYSSALAEISVSDRAYELTSENTKQKLDEVRDILAELTNPVDKNAT